VWCDYCMVGGYFTDVMLHSSRNYHQERATELRRLSKNVAIDCFVKFPRSFLSVLVVICGSYELEQVK